LHKFVTTSIIYFQPHPYQFQHFALPYSYAQTQLPSQFPQHLNFTERGFDRNLALHCISNKMESNVYDIMRKGNTSDSSQRKLRRSLRKSSKRKASDRHLNFCKLYFLGDQTQQLNRLKCFFRTYFSKVKDATSSEESSKMCFEFQIVKLGVIIITSDPPTSKLLITSFIFRHFFFFFFFHDFSKNTFDPTENK